MGLTKTVLKRPVTTLIVVLCLIVFGVTSVTSNKLELMSEINMPMLIISAIYPGASPEDVEELVVKEIEDEVGTLSGVDTITSVSSENYGMVLLQYEYGTDIDVAYDDLKKKIDALAPDLPDDVDTPTIIEMDINDLTSFTVAMDSYKQMSEWNAPYFIKKAMTVGPNTVKVIQTILKSREHEVQTYRLCLGILNFTKKYSKLALEDCCKIAVETNHMSYSFIKNSIAAVSDEIGTAGFNTKLNEERNKGAFVMNPHAGDIERLLSKSMKLAGKEDSEDD